MKDMDLKKNSLSLYFVIAFALPIVTTIIIALVAGSPSGIVVNEISGAALVVFMAMVHAPTIAAVIVVFRSQGFEGIKVLFRQLKYWKFAPQWYLKAILIFPATMLAVLFALSLRSSNFAPELSLSVLAFGALFSALWEEIGWTGFATPVMLKSFSPLKVGLLLGFLHAMWHLAASIYGAGAFHGNLFIVNFLATSVGIIGLRIVTIWIYTRTSSLVLGWLTHASFTGGQLLLVSLDLTSGETVVWNSAFSLSVIGIVVFLVVWNKDLMGRLK
ncbi:MAG: CPBP family intramembrane metalloprotease [Gammaproteobacteria bacterium]|nr:CPBP family intramembrane metalloprotease [Gammaproteobacteria bacterium]